MRSCVISPPKHRLILRPRLSYHERLTERDPGGEKPAISGRTENENRQLQFVGKPPLGDGCKRFPGHGAGDSQLSHELGREVEGCFVPRGFRLGLPVAALGAASRRGSFASGGH